MIRLGRLHFLISGVLLNLLGVSIALYQGVALNWTTFLLGQLAITATQLMTHYANEYYDLPADQANLTPTNWSGGSRILVEGQVSPSLTRHIALGCGTVALITNGMLTGIVDAGIITFGLLFTAQLLAWFYSAPPLRLHSRGLGELSATLVVSVLTPLTGYFLQAQTIDGLVVLAVIPLCAVQFAMLLSIEFPDESGDRRVGKRTLVVRLGARKAARLYGLLLVTAFAILPFLMYAGLPQEVALALYVLTPLAASLLWRVKRGDWHDPARWNHFAFYTIVLLVGMNLLATLMFFLLTGLR